MIQPAIQPRSAGTPDWVLRWSLGLLGLSMLGLGAAFLFAGEYLAETLGFVYDPHVFKEQGMSAMAATVALMAGALRHEFRAGAVVLAVPLGLLQGINAVLDLHHLAKPMAELIHGFQALLAITAGITWWRCRYHG